MKSIWLLVFAVACATAPARVDGPAEPVPMQCDKLGCKPNASKPDEAKLLKLVKDVVSVRFGKDVDNVKMKLWWIEYPPPPFGGKTYYGGLCFSCEEMYVTDYGKWSLCESSYIHEAIHCLQGVVTGDTDPDHERKEWWELVEPITQICRERGWQ